MDMKLHHILDTSGSYVYVAISREKLEEIKQWCLDQDSPGKFSMGGHGMYFESAEDATWVKLKWA